MNTAVGLCVAVAPRQEDADTTPEQAVPEVRTGGAALLLFGGALLYAVLTAGGQPVDPVQF
jgi:hypothetical protein